MKINFNKSTMIEEMLITGLKLKTYKKIMEKVKSVDVSLDEDFQKTFNSFYVVRRNVKWRKSFYTLFEVNKNDLMSFEVILNELYVATNQVEASFVSKMMATIDPKYPIWDQYVIEKLGYADQVKKISSMSPSDKLVNYPIIYKKICKWYSEYLKSSEGQECIAIFDKNIPTYSFINNVKKIDFCLWGIREDDY